MSEQDPFDSDKTLIELYAQANKTIEELRSQVALKDSTIAGLVEAVESLRPDHSPECIGRMMVCRTGSEECICGADTGMQIADNALRDTQATAQAHDAEVVRNSQILSQKTMEKIFDDFAERNTRIKDLCKCLDLAILHIEKENSGYWPETTKLARLNLFRASLEKARALSQDSHRNTTGGEG